MIVSILLITRYVVRRSLLQYVPDDVRFFLVKRSNQSYFMERWRQRKREAYLYNCTQYNSGCVKDLVAQSVLCVGERIGRQKQNTHKIKS